MIVLMLGFSTLSSPLQSASKFMKNSPLVYHSNNIEVPAKWRKIISHPGFVNPEPIPKKTFRAYSIAGVPVNASEEAVVLEDKYGQLSNPLNAIVKLRRASAGKSLGVGLNDITTQAAGLGISPAHFTAVSPYKTTQPNVIYHSGSKASDVFFVGFQSIDARPLLNGVLHCAYTNPKGTFDYAQIHVSEVESTTLGLFMNDICQNLKNQLK
jgi:hypothetical protein